MRERDRDVIVGFEPAVLVLKAGIRPTTPQPLKRVES